MTNFISRLGKNKVYLKIELKLKELECTKESLDHDFFLQWKRGPQVEQTETYNFGPESKTSLLLNDKYERLSGFYQTKREWSKKECMFQLMAMKKGKAKVLTECKYNMSDLIGDINKKADIDLGKGFILKTQWNILPACPKLHAALFKNMQDEDESSNVNQLQRQASSLEADDSLQSTKESEAIIKELYDENEMLKSQIASGPSQSESNPKVLNEMGYLIKILSEKESQIEKLKAQSLKKDNEMQYLISILQKQAQNSVQVDEKVQKQMSEISYMEKLLMKSETKFQEQVHKCDKMTKQISYMTELLAKADAKAHPTSDKETKLLKEIDYLTTLLQQKHAVPEVPVLDDAKYMKEISYLMELLKRASEIEEKVAILHRQNSSRSGQGSQGDDSKYIQQIQYLVDLMKKEEQKLHKAQELSNKKSKEISYMSRLLEKTQTLYDNEAEKTQKMKKQITYLMDILEKTQVQKEKSDSQISKMSKEIDFMMSLLKKTESKHSDSLDMVSKLKKELSYMMTLLQSSQPNKDNSADLETKMKKEIDYLLSMLQKDGKQAVQDCSSDVIEKMRSQISYLVSLLSKSFQSGDVEILKENTQMKMRLTLAEQMLNKSQKDVKDLKFIVDQQKIQMVNNISARKSTVRKSTGFKF